MASRSDDEELRVRYHVMHHQLPRAIERDDVDTLRKFLALYPNVPRWEDKEMSLMSPMAMAASVGALGALDVLLKHHARDMVPRRSEDFDIPRPFFTPLNAACRAAQTSAVRYLLALDPPWDIEELDDYGNTPLLSALQANSTQAEQSEDIVRLLLDRGANATAVVKCREQLNTPPANTVVATALTKAMPSASPRVINWLAEAGARLHGRVHLDTPLHIGCSHHNVHGVRTLLQLGGTSDLTTPDSAGQLPLHRAADWRKVWRNVKWGSFPEEPLSMTIFHEIVALLLSDDHIRQATLDAKDSSGNTPLHLAAGFYYLPVLHQLLDCGADPSIRDGEGRSLLHVLLSSIRPQYDLIPCEIESGLDKDLIHLLLSHLVDQRNGDRDRDRDTETDNDYDLKSLINEPDAQGNTPLHLAANAWLERTIDVLLGLGARPDARNYAGDTPAHLAASLRDLTVDGDPTEVLAKQDRALALLTPAGASLDDSELNDAGETPRAVLERERARLQRNREWSVKRCALQDGAWQELARIAQLPRELQDKAKRTSRWCGVGRGWGVRGWNTVKVDLLAAASAYVRGDGREMGRERGNLDMDEIMRRLDGLLQEQH